MHTIGVSSGLVDQQASKVESSIRQVNKTMYSRMDQVKFWKTAFKKSEVIWSNRPYHFKYFKGCLPEILLGPLLNTFSQIFLL